MAVFIFTSGHSFPCGRFRFRLSPAISDMICTTRNSFPLEERILNQNKHIKKDKTTRTSWDPLAAWYDSWMGQNGSQHHRKLAIPALMALLQPQPKERVLDIGAGQGVLAPAVVEAGAHYLGVDLSGRLLRRARRHHSRLRPQACFVQGDARQLARVEGVEQGAYDAAVFLLSIQDMDPLGQVLASAAWALRANGRLAILMTHPCFRVPRQSGWGWDENRKLRFRRVDRYLTALPVPLRPYPGGVSTSFHRPLQAYINGLGRCGVLVDRIKEVPVRDVLTFKKQRKADRRANEEIPLFLGIRAIKITQETDS